MGAGYFENWIAKSLRLIQALQFKGILLYLSGNTSNLISQYEEIDNECRIF